MKTPATMDDSDSDNDSFLKTVLVKLELADEESDGDDTRQEPSTPYAKRLEATTDEPQTSNCPSLSRPKECELRDEDIKPDVRTIRIADFSATGQPIDHGEPNLCPPDVKSSSPKLNGTHSHPPTQDRVAIRNSNHCQFPGKTAHNPFLFHAPDIRFHFDHGVGHIDLPTSDIPLDMRQNIQKDVNIDVSPELENLCVQTESPNSSAEISLNGVKEEMPSPGSYSSLSSPSGSIKALMNDVEKELKTCDIEDNLTPMSEDGTLLKPEDMVIRTPPSDHSVEDHNNHRQTISTQTEGETEVISEMNKEESIETSLTLARPIELQPNANPIAENAIVPESLTQNSMTMAESVVHRNNRVMDPGGTESSDITHQPIPMSQTYTSQDGTHLATGTDPLYTNHTDTNRPFTSHQEASCPSQHDQQTNNDNHRGNTSPAADYSSYVLREKRLKQILEDIGWKEEELAMFSWPTFKEKTAALTDEEQLILKKQRRYLQNRNLRNNLSCNRPSSIQAAQNENYVLHQHIFAAQNELQRHLIPIPQYKVCVENGEFDEISAESELSENNARHPDDVKALLILEKIGLTKGKLVYRTPAALKKDMASFTEAEQAMLKTFRRRLSCRLYSKKKRRKTMSQLEILNRENDRLDDHLHRMEVALKEAKVQLTEVYLSKRRHHHTMSVLQPATTEVEVIDITGDTKASNVTNCSPPVKATTGSISMDAVDNVQNNFLEKPPSSAQNIPEQISTSPHIISMRKNPTKPDVIMIDDSDDEATPDNMLYCTTASGPTPSYTTPNNTIPPLSNPSNSNSASTHSSPEQRSTCKTMDSGTQVVTSVSSMPPLEQIHWSQSTDTNQMAAFDRKDEVKQLVTGSFYEVATQTRSVDVSTQTNVQKSNIFSMPSHVNTVPSPIPDATVKVEDHKRISDDTEVFEVAQDLSMKSGSDTEKRSRQKRDHTRVYKSVTPTAILPVTDNDQALNLSSKSPEHNQITNAITLPPLADSNPHVPIQLADSGIRIKHEIVDNSKHIGYIIISPKNNKTISPGQKISLVEQRMENGKTESRKTMYEVRKGPELNELLTIPSTDVINDESTAGTTTTTTPQDPHLLLNQGVTHLRDAQNCTPVKPVTNVTDQDHTKSTQMVTASMPPHANNIVSSSTLQASYTPNIPENLFPQQYFNSAHVKDRQQYGPGNHQSQAGFPVSYHDLPMSQSAAKMVITNMLGDRNAIPPQSRQWTVPQVTIAPPAVSTGSSHNIQNGFNTTGVAQTARNTAEYTQGTQQYHHPVYANAFTPASYVPGVYQQNNCVMQPQHGQYAATSTSHTSSSIEQQMKLTTDACSGNKTSQQSLQQAQPKHRAHMTQPHPFQHAQTPQPLQPTQLFQPQSLQISQRLQTLQTFQPPQAMQISQPLLPLKTSQPQQMLRQSQPLQPSLQLQPPQLSQPLQPSHQPQLSQPLQPSQPQQPSQPLQPSQPPQLSQTPQNIQPFQPFQKLLPAQPLQSLQPLQTPHPPQNMQIMQSPNTLEVKQPVQAQPPVPPLQILRTIQTSKTMQYEQTSQSPQISRPSQASKPPQHQENNTTQPTLASSQARLSFQRPQISETIQPQTKKPQTSHTKQPQTKKLETTQTKQPQMKQSRLPSTVSNLYEAKQYTSDPAPLTSHVDGATSEADIVPKTRPDECDVNATGYAVSRNTEDNQGSILLPDDPSASRRDSGPRLNTVEPQVGKAGNTELGNEENVPSDESPCILPEGTSVSESTEHDGSLSDGVKTMGPDLTRDIRKQGTTEINATHAKKRKHKAKRSESTKSPGAKSDAKQINRIDQPDLTISVDPKSLANDGINTSRKQKSSTNRTEKKKSITEENKPKSLTDTRNLACDAKGSSRHSKVHKSSENNSTKITSVDKAASQLLFFDIFSPPKKQTSTDVYQKEARRRLSHLASKTNKAKMIDRAKDVKAIETSPTHHSKVQLLASKSTSPRRNTKTDKNKTIKRRSVSPEALNIKSYKSRKSPSRSINANFKGSKSSSPPRGMKHIGPTDKEGADDTDKETTTRDKPIKFPHAKILLVRSDAPQGVSNHCSAKSKRLRIEESSKPLTELVVLGRSDAPKEGKGKTVLGESTKTYSKRKPETVHTTGSIPIEFSLTPKLPKVGTSPTQDSQSSEIKADDEITSYQRDGSPILGHCSKRAKLDRTLFVAAEGQKNAQDMSTSAKNNSEESDASSTSLLESSAKRTIEDNKSNIPFKKRRNEFTSTPQSATQTWLTSTWRQTAPNKDNRKASKDLDPKAADAEVNLRPQSPVIPSNSVITKEADTSESVATTSDSNTGGETVVTEPNLTTTSIDNTGATDPNVTNSDIEAIVETVISEPNVTALDIKTTVTTADEAGHMVKPDTRADATGHHCEHLLEPTRASRSPDEEIQPFRYLSSQSKLCNISTAVEQSDKVAPQSCPEVATNSVIKPDASLGISQTKHKPPRKRTLQSKKAMQQSGYGLGQPSHNTNLQGQRAIQPGPQANKQWYQSTRDPRTCNYPRAQTQCDQYHTNRQQIQPQGQPLQVANVPTTVHRPVAMKPQFAGMDRGFAYPPIAGHNLSAGNSQQYSSSPRRPTHLPKHQSIIESCARMDQPPNRHNTIQDDAGNQLHQSPMESPSLFNLLFTEKADTYQMAANAPKQAVPPQTSMSEEQPRFTQQPPQMSPQQAVYYGQMPIQHQNYCGPQSQYRSNCMQSPKIAPQNPNSVPQNLNYDRYYTSTPQ